MQTNLTSMIITGLFFVCIFLSGYWLKGSGKPYNGLKLNLHKFLSLGAAAYLIVLVIDVNRAAGLLASGIVFLVISALLFLVLIISGGLLSAVKESPLFLQFIHRMLPYLAAAATAGLLYFLL